MNQIMFNILYMIVELDLKLFNWCKDSICNDPKLVLGSNVKGPNNKICREWAERLGLGHRTMVSQGIHGRRIEVN